MTGDASQAKKPRRGGQAGQAGSTGHAMPSQSQGEGHGAGGASATRSTPTAPAPTPLAAAAAAAAAYVAAAFADTARSPDARTHDVDGSGASSEDDDSQALPWTDHSLAYLFRTVKEDLAAGRRPDYGAILKHLGWDNRPGGVVLHRLRSKYCVLRRVAESGGEFAGRTLPKARYPYPLLRRVQEALLSLPAHQGTAREVCAIISADPAYAPHLDRRPQTTDGTRLERWQKQVGRILSGRQHCGFVNTGARKGGLCVYKYDASRDERVAPVDFSAGQEQHDDGIGAGGGGGGAQAAAQPDAVAAGGGAGRRNGAAAPPALAAGQPSGGGGGGPGRRAAAGGAGVGRQAGRKRVGTAAEESAVMEAVALAALEALERGQEVRESEIAAAAAAGRGLAGLR